MACPSFIQPCKSLKSCKWSKQLCRCPSPLRTAPIWREEIRNLISPEISPEGQQKPFARRNLPAAQDNYVISAFRVCSELFLSEVGWPLGKTRSSIRMCLNIKITVYRSLPTKPEDVTALQANNGAKRGLSHNKSCDTNPSQSRTATTHPSSWSNPLTMFPIWWRYQLRLGHTSNRNSQTPKRSQFES